MSSLVTKRLPEYFYKLILEKSQRTFFLLNKKITTKEQVISTRENWWEVRTISKAYTSRHDF